MNIYIYMYKYIYIYIYIYIYKFFFLSSGRNLRNITLFPKYELVADSTPFFFTKALRRFKRWVKDSSMTCALIVSSLRL